MHSYPEPCRGSIGVSTMHGGRTIRQLHHLPRIVLFRRAARLRRDPGKGETNSRIRCGVELDPLHVDVVGRRFEAATGEAAVLSATGEPFEALTARRTLEAVPAFGVTHMAAGRSKRATGGRQGCHASPLAVDRALASPLPR